MKKGKNTQIHKTAIIGSNVILGNNVVVMPYACIGNDCKIGNNVLIGNYALIRDSTIIGDDSVIGAYSEIARSIINNNVSVGHRSFIADAEIGMNTIIGANLITANFDGENKNKTVIHKDVFIGARTTLISPIIIGSKSYIAANSYLREDVKQNKYVSQYAKPKVKENEK